MRVRSVARVREELSWRIMAERRRHKKRIQVTSPQLTHRYLYCAGLKHRGHKPGAGLPAAAACLLTAASSRGAVKMKQMTANAG